MTEHGEQRSDPVTDGLSRPDASWFPEPDPVESFGTTIEHALRQLSVELAAIRAERDGLRLEIEGVRAQYELLRQQLADRDRFTATVRELGDIVRNLTLPAGWTPDLVGPPPAAPQAAPPPPPPSPTAAEPAFTWTPPVAPSEPVTGTDPAWTGAAPTVEPAPAWEPPPVPPPAGEWTFPAPDPVAADATTGTDPFAAGTTPPVPPAPETPSPDVAPPPAPALDADDTAPFTVSASGTTEAPPLPPNPLLDPEPPTTPDPTAAPGWDPVVVTESSPASAPVSPQVERFFDQPGVWLGEPPRADRRRERLRTWGSRLATAALAVVVLGVLLMSVGPRVLPYQTYFVRSGSMEPTIGTGSLIFLRETDASELRKGDIITFERPDRPGTMVTHRINAIENTESGRYFQTMGDANGTPDAWRVPATGTGWKYWFNVPRLGFVFGYLGTAQAKLLLLIVPAVLLGVLSLIDIWRPAEGSQPRRRR